MQEFNAEEWHQGKGEIKLDLTSKHYVDIRVSCSKNVQVLGVPEEKGRNATVLKSGTEFRFRGPLKNYQAVVIRGTGKTPFGFRARLLALQQGEPLSDEKPPVLELPEPTNLVAKMRQMSAQAHAISRMPVLEPDDYPSFNRYEFDDDDEILFEEEALAKHQEAQAEEKRKADEAEKARKEAESASPPPQAPPSPAPGEPHEPGAPAPAPAATAAE